MDGLMSWIFNLVSNFGSAVIKLLPRSPFRDFINSWQAPQFLSWLNWIFPVSECVAILTLWLLAIGVFYLYSIIMRWVKIIGD